MVFILSVEGNIGSGKSTILNYLKENNQNSNIIFLKEPVDKWDKVKDIEGKTLLENFYQDSKKYAFMFQIMAFATRMQLLKDTIKRNPECKMIICERSILADQQVFASMLHYDGLIDNMGISIYTTMANNYLKDFPLNGIIYIDAEPEVCIKRIGKRNRTGEAGIELSYLQKCKKYHDDWLNDYPRFTQVPENNPNATSILHIKTNQNASFDISNPNDISNRWLQQIDEYLQSFE
jgi:deoxyadenosine/deoxycytidine kinase|tara:strand:- start:1217 stop:1921 length:705 start_codon:yes stop_codon:yes gene_type:complete